MKFKDSKFGDMTGQTYNGKLDASKLGLTSLEGSPETVIGSFLVFDNNLTSLEGGPKTVTGSYYCSNNPNLTTLKGAPTSDMADINFEHTGIKNEIKEIFDNGVKARTYYTVTTLYRWRDLADKYNEYRLNKQIKSKGFKTLLGLKK